MVSISSSSLLHFFRAKSFSCRAWADCVCKNKKRRDFKNLLPHISWLIKSCNQPQLNTKNDCLHVLYIKKINIRIQVLNVKRNFKGYTITGSNSSQSTCFTQHIISLLLNRGFICGWPDTGRTIQLFDMQSLVITSDGSHKKKI